ncbi:MAG: radical SAM protein [Zoogloeaceae bacterium]|nr:radical SAM protein [Zoogloeaceae bacterium]
MSSSENIFRNTRESISVEGTYCAEKTRARIDAELIKRGAQAPVSHADFHSALLATIRNTSRIILRGAGNLGQQMLNYLCSESMAKEKFCFWDKEAERIQEVSGVPVLPPFSGDFSPQETLILHCISSLLPYDAKEYTERGYQEHMEGFSLLCPYNVGLGSQMRICGPNPRCTLIRCPRQTEQGFCYTQHKPNAGASLGTLVSDKLIFRVNTRCTLKCRHCIQYINHFPPEKRLDFPLERILLDMDLACSAHDFIRIGILEGGEPLLHPDFPGILAHLLDRASVGVVIIHSNGIWRTTEENMTALQHERVFLRISSYVGVLDEKQESLLNYNLSRFTEYGIAHVLYQNVWNPVPTLVKREYPVHVLQNFKKVCPYFLECRVVANGAYYPCNFAAVIDLHGVADYPEDRVSLRKEELHERIADLNERPYYQSCAHCDFSKEHVLPGEQGMDARYAHIGGHIPVVVRAEGRLK